MSALNVSSDTRARSGYQGSLTFNDRATWMINLRSGRAELHHCLRLRWRANTTTLDHRKRIPGF